MKNEPGYKSPRRMQYPVCGTDVGVEMHHVKSLGKPEKPLKDSIKDKPRA